MSGPIGKHARKTMVLNVTLFKQYEKTIVTSIFLIQIFPVDFSPDIL